MITKDQFFIRFFVIEIIITNDYNFRDYRFVIFKICFQCKDELFEICIDIEYIMNFIDKQFFKQFITTRLIVEIK